MRKTFSTILVGVLTFFCAFVTVKAPIWYYHEQAKQEFMNGDTKLDENIKKIYDKYGIVVHKQLEDYMAYFFWDTEIAQEYNEESATEMVEDLYYYLEIYSDKVIDTLPKDIYLVQMSSRKDNPEILRPAFIGKFGMVLSVEYYGLCFYELPKILNHEIFHSITNNLWTWEDYKKYHKVNFSFFHYIYWRYHWYT